MLGDKSRNIQNYTLEDKLFVHLDSSEFFMAKHKILKKSFTIRKIKLNNHLCTTMPGQEWSNISSEDVLQQITMETSLLKHLNGVGAPRCHKLIKTSNHFYLVYDEFPSLTLRQYLLNNVLTKSQKLDLMIKISETLRSIHKLGVIVIGLTIENIRVLDNGNILFTDLSIGCINAEIHNVNESFLENYPKENFPRQLLESGSYGYFTDIFILGKMFSAMINRQSSVLAGKYKNIEKIIDNMTKAKPQDRLNIEELIMELENQRNAIIKQRKHSNQINSPLLAPPTLDGHLKHRKYSADCANANSPLAATLRQFIQTKKDTLCTAASENQLSPILKDKTNNNYSISTKTDLLSIKSFNAIGMETFILSKINIPSKTNIQKRISLRSLNSIKNCESSKKINKSRNLCFFILDLSEFVLQQWICPQLGYMLIKYANLTLNDALDQLDKQKELSSQERELMEMIIGEKAKIAASQAKMREIFLKEEVESSFKKELQEQNAISDRYLQSKMIEFGKQILKQLQKPSSHKKSMQESITILFKLYMILKKIQIGSYQKFWQNIYNSSFANLANQRYMQEEKQLGYRYLKSKVNTILGER